MKSKLAGELERHVGAVVISFAELDGAMTGLAGLALGGTEEAVRKVWGGSGKNLSEPLRRAGHRVDELTAIANRYDVVYAARNHLVHSFRPRSEQTLDNVAALKPRRNFDEVGAAYDKRVVGIPKLIDLWYKIQDLLHGAQGLFLNMVFEVDSPSPGE